MNILITIPKEFEQEFNADRFERSLYQLKSCAAYMWAISSKEKTADMLIEAMKNAVPVPAPHGRLIDADALYRTIDADTANTIGHTTFKIRALLDVRGMPTIIEAEEGDTNE